MRFSDIRGNGNIIKTLVGMADSGRVPHAIMMYENEGCGALAIALAFVQYLNCSCPSGGDSCGNCVSCNQNSRLIFPDIRFTFPYTSGTKVSGEARKLTCDDFGKYWKECVLRNPYFLESELSIALGVEKKESVIPVAEAQAIIRRMAISSSSGGYRSVIMWLPEKMNPEAANKLLKSIEEPAEKTVFILITHAPENVMPTIASRCLSLRIGPQTVDEVTETLVSAFGKDAGKAGIAAEFSGGSTGKALYSMAEGEDLTAMRSLFRELMGNLISRNLLAALETGDALAAIASREKQKAFCIFATDCLRKVFMIQQGLPALAGVQPDYEGFYNEVAIGLKGQFCRRAIGVIDNAYRKIDMNVSQKMVFANLIYRLFDCL